MLFIGLDWTGQVQKKKSQKKVFRFCLFSICLSVHLSVYLPGHLSCCLSVCESLASFCLCLSYLISGIRSSDFSLFYFSDSMGIFGVSPISIFTLPYLT